MNKTHHILLKLTESLINYCRTRLCPIYSIPQHLGVEGVRKALDSLKTQKPSTVTLIDCLKLFLNKNDFEFNGCFYTQIHGTSIGPKIAPGYACLGMGVVEDELWQNCLLKPTVWTHYTDDIWGLWPHGPDAFNDFLEILNNLFKSELEFTSCFNFNSLSFLDLCIYRNPEGFLKTDLFVKPTFKTFIFSMTRITANTF